MKVIVNKKPKEPRECFFAAKSPDGSYLCKFTLGVSCDVKRCKYLKEEKY